MPALIPVDNTLGALSIGAVLSSIVYGVTWLQVYSYFSSYCSQDRWPLKFFVAVMTLIDTANHVLCIYMTYQFCVTNFGDYRFIVSHPWSLFVAAAFPSRAPVFSVQHFYAYRIYRLGGGSPYLPAAISVSSLTGFSLGIVYISKLIKHIHDPGNLEGFFVSALSCKVLCDALITTGMAYYLLSNRTQVRRTNNVLNLLAIYSINCGTIHFLNSRDYLRETLDGPGGFVATFTQLKVRTGTPVPWGAQETTEASTTTAVLKNLPHALVPSDISLSDSVIAFDREKYPVMRPAN
ncbi:hypothetical protein EDB83DRAFT_2549620 [Lactarius deliciosus]|nr:hypothetical protein EDB83DRAFT_2549620 [Lactarius deliciosus]